jgi:rod shape-determining protein MreB
MQVKVLPLSTGRYSRDLAVDLGTANTVLCAFGGEIVSSEPSVVAVDARTGGSLAAGTEALELLGRDGIVAVRPLRDGVIVDLPGTEAMLRHLLSSMPRHTWSRPRLVASVPSGISGVQRRAVAEACMAAGAREAHLVAAPIAAAVGCGLPAQEPTGSMTLDIGAGKSEVAMISMAAIVAARSIPIGGHDFDRTIVNHLRRAHGLLISTHTAEQIKFQISSAHRYGHNAEIEIIGRNIASQMLTGVRLTSHEIRGVLERPLSRIVDATKEILRCTPPQLACDVIDHGITLTGGGALLDGLAQRLALEIGMPARVADAPRTCTAIGLARMLKRYAAPAQFSVHPATSVRTVAASN